MAHDRRETPLVVMRRKRSDGTFDTRLLEPMHYARSMSPTLLACIALVCACSGTAVGTRDTAGARRAQGLPAGLCTPSEQQSARATPEAEDCTDENIIDSLVIGCGAEDPPSCFRLAACVSLQLPELDELDDAYAVDAAIEGILQPLAVSCHGGIAAGCRARAAILGRALAARIDTDGDSTELRAAMCGDLVRACRLDAAACGECVQRGCS